MRVRADSAIPAEVKEAYTEICMGIDLAEGKDFTVAWDALEATVNADLPHIAPASSQGPSPEAQALHQR